MKISGLDDCFISIKILERLPLGSQTPGDICCSIEASAHGFRGYDDSLWFSAEAVDEFVVSLRALVKTRQGVARLADFSYGSEACGAALTIQSVSGWGHMALTMEIKKSFASVAVEFELPTDQFLQTVQEIVEFFEAGSLEQ